MQVSLSAALVKAIHLLKCTFLFWGWQIMLWVSFRLYLKCIRSIIPLIYRWSLNLGLSEVLLAHSLLCFVERQGFTGILQFMCTVVLYVMISYAPDHRDRGLGSMIWPGTVF